MMRKVIVSRCVRLLGEHSAKTFTEFNSSLPDRVDLVKVRTNVARRQVSEEVAK